MAKKKQLGTVLRKRKHVSESALEHALEEQKYKLAMLGEILLESGKVSKPDLIAALEEVSGISYLDLETTPVDLRTQYVKVKASATPVAEEDLQ